MLADQGRKEKIYLEQKIFQIVLFRFNNSLSAQTEHFDLNI